MRTLLRTGWCQCIATENGYPTRPEESALGKRGKLTLGRPLGREVRHGQPHSVPEHVVLDCLGRGGGQHLRTTASRGAVLAREGGGSTGQRQCLSRGSGGSTQGKGTVLAHEGSGDTRQRHCLSREGSGNSKEKKGTVGGQESLPFLEVLLRSQVSPGPSGGCTMATTQALASPSPPRWPPPRRSPACTCRYKPLLKRGVERSIKRSVLREVPAPAEVRREGLKNTHESPMSRQEPMQNNRSALHVIGRATAEGRGSGGGGGGGGGGGVAAEGRRRRRRRRLRRRRRRRHWRALPQALRSSSGCRWPPGRGAPLARPALRPGWSINHHNPR